MLRLFLSQLIFLLSPHPGVKISINTELDAPPRPVLIFKLTLPILWVTLIFLGELMYSSPFDGVMWLVVEPEKNKYIILSALPIRRRGFKLFIKVIEVDESIEVTRSVASVLINNLKLNCGIMEWDKVIELAKKKL